MAVAEAMDLKAIGDGMYNGYVLVVPFEVSEENVRKYFVATLGMRRQQRATKPASLGICVCCSDGQLEAI